MNHHRQQQQKHQAATALEFFRSLPAIILAHEIYPFVVPAFSSLEALMRAVDDHVRGRTKGGRPLPPLHRRMDELKTLGSLVQLQETWQTHITAAVERTVSVAPNW
jgi:hypothetical protein